MQASHTRGGLAEPIPVFVEIGLQLGATPAYLAVDHVEVGEGLGSEVGSAVDGFT